MTHPKFSQFASSPSPTGETPAGWQSQICGVLASGSDVIGSTASPRRVAKEN